MSKVSIDQPRRRAVASVLVLTLLLGLALLPNTGAIPADTSCPYGNCPTTNNSPATLWYVLLGVLVLVAAALAVLLVLRRRQGPQAPPPVEPWSGPAASGGAPELAAVAEAPVGPSPTYLESPEDIGQPMPQVTPPPAPAAPEGAGDIDSLMKELDKISGEILQRKPKPPTPGAEEAAEEPKDE